MHPASVSLTVLMDSAHAAFSEREDTEQMDRLRDAVLAGPVANREDAAAVAEAISLACEDMTDIDDEAEHHRVGLLARDAARRLALWAGANPAHFTI